MTSTDLELTVADVAAVIGEAPATVRQRVVRGRVAARRDEEGRIWIPREEADRMVAEAKAAEARAAWRTQAAAI